MIVPSDAVVIPPDDVDDSKLLDLSRERSDSTIWNPSMKGFVDAIPNSVDGCSEFVEPNAVEDLPRTRGSREEELGRLELTACVGRSSMKREARSSVVVEALIVGSIESGRGGSKEVSVRSESERGRFAVEERGEEKGLE